ncbi:endopeptidase IV [Legionella worsleiensis]|uniref:endopeptidase IV n=1 Tax=Legionella worsleiensis TaxID=45076 RepID=UPI0039E9732F
MTIRQRSISTALMLLSGMLYLMPVEAATSKKDTASQEKAEQKDNNKFPTGCTPVGFQQSLKVLSLYPGKEGALQSMYFFFNKLPQTVSLYQMRDKESEYSTRMNHSIKANSWAVLATGEREVKFICTLGDGKASYGKILDCADTIKVCEYVNVKFGLNNKGNFWIVNSNSRNGAVSEVVHYGIIPGV